MAAHVTKTVSSLPNNRISSYSITHASPDYFPLTTVYNIQTCNVFRLNRNNCIIIIRLTFRESNLEKEKLV